MSQEEGDPPDKVGYGSPPRASQFKKGGPSPNPAGRRPKAAPAPQQAGRRSALDELVLITFQGKKIEVTAMQAIEYQTIDSALKGDPVARKEAFRLQAKRDAADLRYRIAHPEQVREHRPPPLIRFATYAQGFLESLGIVVDIGDNTKIPSFFVIAALQRMTKAAVEAIDWSKEYHEVLDPEPVRDFLVANGLDPPETPASIPLPPVAR